MTRSTGFIPNTLVYMLVLTGTVPCSGRVWTEPQVETFIQQNIDQTYASIYEDLGDRSRDDRADLTAQEVVDNKPPPPTTTFSIVELEILKINFSEEELNAAIKNHENDIISNLKDERVVGVGVACRIVDVNKETNLGNVNCYIIFGFAEAQQKIKQPVYRRLTVDEKAKAVASRSKTVLSKQDDKEKEAGISTGNEREIGAGSDPNGTSASLASSQDNDGDSSVKSASDPNRQQNNVGTYTTTGRKCGCPHPHRSRATMSPTWVWKSG